jgi:hypothetical protein
VAATNDFPFTASGQKPAWLSELSFSTRESYDNNIFLSGADARYYPAYSAPSGSAVAYKNSSAWVTTLTPKVGFNLLPFWNGQGSLQTLSLAYAPECAIYQNHSSENFQAHRIVAAMKGKSDDVSFGVDNNFSFVNGDRTAPFYPGNFLSAYGIAAPRERREQLQDRANVLVQYDQPHWFARATGSLLYYDLMTRLINTPGYQNFCDRYDANGGGDVGFKILPQLAFTVGWRYGHQYQQSFSFSPYNSSSDYQRVLFGLEGKPLSWLEFKFQAGPDFRSYNSAAPVNDANCVKYFGEGSLTATITTNDSVAIKYKQWQWVSSTGKVPCFDTACDLNYHHQFSSKLGLDLAGRFLEADYHSGNLPTCHRDDTEYVASTGLTYAVNAHLNFTATAELDFGRNDQPNLANPSTRDFNRQLYSLGAQWKF